MPQDFDSTKRIYMEVSFGGYLYQKVASAEVEGAYSYQYEDKETGEMVTKFRRKWRATSFGKVINLRLKDSDYGKVLEIQLQTSEDEVEVLSINRKVNKGLNPFYRDLASKMGNVDWSRPISFSPNTSKYRTNRDGSIKVNKKGVKMLVPSLWINYSQKEYVPLKYKYCKRGETPKEGDIPNGEYIEGLDGKEYSSKIPDMFLDAKMKEAIKSFEDYKNSKSNSAPQPQPQPTPKSVETPTSNEEEDDDLPF